MKYGKQITCVCLLLLLTGCGREKEAVWLSDGTATEMVAESLSDETAEADYGKAESAGDGTKNSSAVQTGTDSGSTADAQTGIHAEPAGGSVGNSGTAETGNLCVYLCGAVNQPGVYELPAGSRIYEAVALAGGMREDACMACINQADCLTDGQMIYVLTQQEAEQGGSQAAFLPESAADSQVKQTQTDNTKAESPDTGRIDLNTADEAALLTLPGIGASKAADILAYRREHGDFKSTEELMNIRGIKEGIYAKIKDYITVN